MKMPFSSPSTRQYAREVGVDLTALSAELGRDHIHRHDIDDKLSGNSVEANVQLTKYWEIDHKEYGVVREEKVSKFSRVAASNLTAAHQLIPSVTHHSRADVSRIERMRSELKDEAKARGCKLTALAFHAKVLARTLLDHPRFNASLSADGETLFIKQFVHIGIAVDTSHGLVVPVLRDVDRKGLWEIASDISALSERAHERKLSGGEMGGASMSISNLGGIGGTGFTPIVNPPEVAILGISRTDLAPVWTGESFVATPMTPLDLSYDHRVINGADAARFLQRYAELLANPLKLMI